MIKINDNIKIYYPLKMVPRQQQFDILDFTKNTINNGNKYVLINASTGSGKSYFTVMFMNWYKNSINKSAKFDILTNSKILQHQYVNDYSFMKNLKGRSNYYCDPYDTDCSKGWEICKLSGPKCGADCPYIAAKSNWMGSSVGLTNFHLFNTYGIYTNILEEDRNADVLIIDEGHDFEAVFCDFISTTLSAKSLKKYGFDLKKIEDYDDRITRIKTIDQFIGFIENQFIKDVSERLSWFEAKQSKASKKIKAEYGNYIQFCSSQLSKFNYLIEEYGKDKANWILDITLNEKDKMYSGLILDAKPVWGSKFLKEVIFSKYDHVIFMSASILDKEMFGFINGLKSKFTSYIDVPSDFPLKNRPIYFLKGIGKMTYTEKFDTFERQLQWMEKILKKYKNKKGIIHCGTYDIANWMKERADDPRFLFHTSENRNEILMKHINSITPTILVSPSMISGVDLKDDISRFQIILKIPFPYLGSEKIKQRMSTNKKWYNWKTVSDLIQMYGRSVRSKDDYADTYILDDSFSDILKYNSAIIPRWFSDAIKYLKV